MRRLPALIIFGALLGAPAAAETCLITPFTNRSGDARLDWISESISETLRETLASEGLVAVTREARIAAVRKLSLRPNSPLTLASIIKLAEATAAGTIVYGHFELLNDAAPAVAPTPGVPAPASTNRGSLRVTVRLFYPSTTTQREVTAETGALEDLAVVQTQVAWQVLRALRPGLPITREQWVAKQPRVKLTALENYMRGLMAPNADVQHRYFTQAARIDPTFPNPSFHLGKMHFDKDNYREAAKWLEKVPATASSGLEAAFLLGLSRYEIGDFEGARQAYQQLLTVLDVPEVHNNLGAVLLRLDQPEAMDHLKRALDADSSDPDYLFNVGYSLWKRGDFDGATERFRAVLDRERDDPDTILMLGRSLKKTGPRAGDTRGQGLERLKESWEDRPKK